jgi:hypothetical protein
MSGKVHLQPNKRHMKKSDLYSIKISKHPSAQAVINPIVNFNWTIKKLNDEKNNDDGIHAGSRPDP